MQKNQAVYEALRRHNTEGLIEASAESSGIYMQFKLPVTMNMERLVKLPGERKIGVVPGSGFYISGCRTRGKFIRISISRAGLDQIDEGLRLLSRRWSGKADGRAKPFRLSEDKIMFIICL
jgi:DNA-binding transcriptional MocR family regulator